MKTIWKFAIDFAEPFELRTTLEAQVVHFGMQNDQPTFWMEFTPGAHSTVKRNFQIFSTGHDIPDHAIHLGTTFDGPFVWHLYETTQ